MTSLGIEHEAQSRRCASNGAKHLSIMLILEGVLNLVKY